MSDPDRTQNSDDPMVADDPVTDDPVTDDEPTILNTLSDTAQRFLDDPEVDVATGRDLPDDASGEEPPQDGDPAR
jgi:hypothetical protein